MTAAAAWRKVFHVLLVVLPLGVAGNIVFALLKTDLRSLPAHHCLRFEWLPVALTLCFMPWFMTAARLRRWTVFLGRRLTFSRCLHITMGTELGAAVTPTLIGGGYLKLGMLVQSGFPAGRAAAVMLMVILEDALFMSVAMPLAFIAAGGASGLGIQRAFRIPNPSAAVAVLSAAALAAVIFIALSRRRSGGPGKFIERICAAWRRFASDFRIAAGLVRGGGGRVVAGNVLLAAVQWICRYQIITAFFAFLALPIRPAAFYFYQWIVFTLGTMVVTPGGMGGVEAIFCVLFRPFIPTGMTGLVTAGWRFLTSHVQVIAAAVLFFGIELKSKKLPETHSDDGRLAQTLVEVRNETGIPAGRTGRPLFTIP